MGPSLRSLASLLAIRMLSHDLSPRQPIRELLWTLLTAHKQWSYDRTPKLAIHGVNSIGHASGEGEGVSEATTKIEGNRGQYVKTQ
jgi:hypothetical protein